MPKTELNGGSWPAYLDRVYFGHVFVRSKENWPKSHSPQLLKELREHVFLLTIDGPSCNNLLNEEVSNWNTRAIQLCHNTEQFHTLTVCSVSRVHYQLLGFCNKLVNCRGDKNGNSSQVLFLGGPDP